MGAPKAPDPDATAAAQFKYGKQAAVFNQGLNQTNQVTPQGTLTYTRTGTNPDGSPKYTATTKYNPQEQALFNASTATGTAAANAAKGILTKNAGMFANGPDLGPTMDETGITKAITGWGQEYLGPQQEQKRAALEAKLRNQGLAPGSEAWNNAISLNERGNNDQMIQLLLQGQNTALAAGNQNMQRGHLAYSDPLQAYSTLSGGTTQQAQMNFAQTPQSQTQAPDYQGAAQNKYQADSEAYKAKMGGLFSIPAAIFGGWGR